jgi:hypothetical protein
MRTCFRTLCAAVAFAGLAAAEPLPAAYFRLMEAGAKQAQARLDAMPSAGLAELEKDSRWRHFPYAILALAVLYAKRHPANPRYHDAGMLALAVRVGDLLAAEDEKGAFEPRLDSDWDTYMWLETYRLLESELGADRRERWRRAIERNIAPYLEQAKERIDFPWYNSPYISTSPNHYSLWAANLLLGARVLGHKEWEPVATHILHRFATVEQAPDGYWGEHSRLGPAIGYNHLTLSAVALYWELTKDPAALPALRRATDFHKNFTWPDGTPVEVINNRNRHWGVSAWSQFAFSNFPDGRGYAEFLTSRYTPEKLTVDVVGRLAQDALYYHEGPTEPAPQQRPAYAYQMSIPASIRKTGPWSVALSGIIDTNAVRNQFYLERQANLSVFHEKLGLIISGGNSKRQPELATFSEKLDFGEFHLPLSSRVQMGDAQDRLSLAYNTFWADVLVPRPAGNALDFKIAITGVNTPAAEARLALQVVLKPGEPLETGAGRRFTVGTERMELSPEDLGGEIRHNGWSMRIDPDARFAWPVYPFNPYANGPETNLEYAVATLTVPLKLKPQPGKSVRPKEREIAFSIRATQ